MHTVLPAFSIGLSIEHYTNDGTRYDSIIKAADHGAVILRENAVELQDSACRGDVWQAQVLGLMSVDVR